MSCDGLNALNPYCQAAQIITDQATAAADSAFSHIAGFFGIAAMNATTWLWQQIGDATTLDLRSPALVRHMTASAAVAGIACLALFCIQVIAAILRREPGGLGRAIRGLGVGLVGSAVAVLTAQVLLTATDALSAGLVQFTLGTNIQGLGSKLMFTYLAGIQNPAILMLVSAAIEVAVIMVWGAMVIRKLTIIVAAVLAPIAFAGAAADITRSWVRRWIELVVAMIVSKLLLVIILSVGVAVLNTAGQVGSGFSQVATQLACSCLILLLGGFAPWLAIRMCHFGGDILYAAHTHASTSTSGARSVVSAPRKVAGAKATATWLTPRPHGSQAYPPNPTRPGLSSSPRPATAAAMTGASAAGAGPAVLAVGGHAAGGLVSTMKKPFAVSPAVEGNAPTATLLGPTETAGAGETTPTPVHGPVKQRKQ